MKQQKEYLKVKPLEVIALLGTYVCLSLFYYITIWISGSEYRKEGATVFSLSKWFDDGGLQYILMFFTTIFIWYFVFRLFGNWSLVKRLSLHILGLPLFVFVAQQGYYWVSEQLDMGHLTGGGAIWDIFIPALIYLIQFSAIHAYEYYVISQRKLRTEIELKNAALKSELSALKAQLNPHFLYNVFNTINASVPPEMENTREMIAGLSDLFRYQLKASIEDLVPLKDEIEFVQQYLELEKKRFEERLNFKIVVPKELELELIPPMILQPIVENSVKHGIAPLMKGGSIEIVISRDNNRLKFSVKDSGVGISDVEGIFEKGIGLGNTQQRLKKMYNSSIKLESNQPSGLTVSFVL